MCEGYTVLAVDYLGGESVLDHLGKPGFDWRPWVAPIKERAPGLAKVWLEGVRKMYGACYRGIMCFSGMADRILEGAKFFCIGMRRRFIVQGSG